MPSSQDTFTDRGGRWRKGLRLCLARVGSGRAGANGRELELLFNYVEWCSQCHGHENHQWPSEERLHRKARLAIITAARLLLEDLIVRERRTRERRQMSPRGEHQGVQIGYRVDAGGVQFTHRIMGTGHLGADMVPGNFTAVNCGRAVYRTPLKTSVNYTYH
jgi:hypothetical protein